MHIFGRVLILTQTALRPVAPLLRSTQQLIKFCVYHFRVPVGVPVCNTCEAVSVYVYWDFIMLNMGTFSSFQLYFTYIQNLYACYKTFEIFKLHRPSFYM